MTQRKNVLPPNNVLVCFTVRLYRLARASEAIGTLTVYSEIGIQGLAGKRLQIWFCLPLLGFVATARVAIVS